MKLSDLELRQLMALVEPLMARLFSTDVSDWSALARRESAETDSLIEYLWGCREQCAPFALAAAKGPDSNLRRFTGRFVNWAVEQNQFFELDSRGAMRLVSAHRILLREVGRALGDAPQLEVFAATVNRSLFRFVERVARLFRSLGHGVTLGRGSEYTPELQLQLLGLDRMPIAEPLLDLGCGKSGELVQLLRSRGVAATGLDRLAVGDGVVARDWFEVRFEPNTLGTIVSHLAFSLHFLHHHWHPGERAYAYARKYMELLASLKSGGRFIYTPGLPFIEPMLDETQYLVEKLPLPDALAPLVESLRDLGTGQTVAYVTQITKR